MLALLATLVRLPTGLQFIAYFLFVVIPLAVGAALVWAGLRGSSARASPEEKRLAGLKDQIVWRALAKDGQITVSEAVAELQLEPGEAERALMALVADGRAGVEPQKSGEVVYRIESVVAAPGRETDDT